MDTKAQTHLIHKTTLRTIVHGALISTAGGIALKTLAALSIVITLRYIGVFDYGLWKLALGVVGFAISFTLPRLESVFLADMSKELGRGNIGLYKSMFTKVSFLFISLGLLAGAVIFVAGPVIRIFSGIELTSVLRILSLAIILSGIERVYLLIFQTHLEFGKVETYKFISRLIGIITLVITIFVLGLSLFALVISYVASVLVPLVVLTPAFIHNMRKHAHVSPQPFSLRRVFVGHGKWAIISSYFESATISARPWVIAYFVGVEQMVIVTIALTIFSELTHVLPLNTILAPIIPREIGESERLKIIFERGTKYSMWLFSLLGLGFFLLGPFMIRILFPQYSGSILYLYYLIPLMPIVPISYMVTQVLYALKAQKELFKSVFIVRGLSTILILPLLLHLIGPIGAIINYIVATIALITIRLTYLRKIKTELYMKWTSLFLFNEDDKLFIKRIKNGFLRQIGIFGGGIMK